MFIRLNNCVLADIEIPIWIYKRHFSVMVCLFCDWEEETDLWQEEVCVLSWGKFVLRVLVTLLINGQQ